MTPEVKEWAKVARWVTPGSVMDGEMETQGEEARLKCCHIGVHTFVAGAAGPKHLRPAFSATGGGLSTCIMLYSVWRTTAFKGEQLRKERKEGGRQKQR